MTIYAQDPTQMSMNWIRECPPLTARMWKDAYTVYHTEMRDDDWIRPEVRREIRGGATGMEVCMTQDANQYKMGKCIAQEIDDGNFREGGEAERQGRTR